MVVRARRGEGASGAPRKAIRAACRRAVLVWAGAVAAVGGAAGTAEARVAFTVLNVDAPGEGFNDPRAAAPVGGNPGTTLGAQRLNAFSHAAERWAQVLDGAVPVVIEASFAPLPCEGDSVTLGNARPAQFLLNSPGLPQGIWVPLPLANQLGGRRLYEEPDIEATFNGALAECAGPENDWYYGLDGDAGDRSDLVSVVMHELAHGLGFTSLVDPVTGADAMGMLDVFSAHVFDLALGRAWPQMTAAQRVASAMKPRGLVWNGANVTRVAPGVLSRGSPFVRYQPQPARVSDLVSEAEFGASAAARPLSGRVVAVQRRAGNCPAPTGLSGAVAMFVGEALCPPMQEAEIAEEAGAVAALISDGRGVTPPYTLSAPFSHRASLGAVTIPALGITDADAVLLAAAASSNLTAEIGGDDARLVGADPQGRVYLFASTPVMPTSTVSHWDTLARPDLLQEPESPTVAPHDLRLELALMLDLGWKSLCGNGVMDAGEECDSGGANSDVTADACRTTCVRARCGDGVKDQAEACDDGAFNGTAGATCRANCTAGSGGGTGGTPGGGTGGTSGGTGGGGGGGDGGGCGCALAGRPDGVGASALLLLLGALRLRSRRAPARRR